MFCGVQSNKQIKISQAFFDLFFRNASNPKHLLLVNLLMNLFAVADSPKRITPFIPLFQYFKCFF
jgi:hypothetical protein